MLEQWIINSGCVLPCMFQRKKSSNDLLSCICQFCSIISTVYIKLLIALQLEENKYIHLKYVFPPMYSFSVVHVSAQIGSFWQCVGRMCLMLRLWTERTCLRHRSSPFSSSAFRAAHHHLQAVQYSYKLFFNTVTGVFSIWLMFFNKLVVLF